MTSEPCRVAICDDVPDFRRVLCMVLGVEPTLEVVGEAGDGRQAIDLVSSTAVDVLLLDIAMPIMDGIEALPKILEASPSTRVVMLTGFGSDAIRRQAETLGACAFLEKGVAPAAIVDAIASACAS